MQIGVQQTQKLLIEPVINSNLCGNKLAQIKAIVISATWVDWGVYKNQKDYTDRFACWHWMSLQTASGSSGREA